MNKKMFGKLIVMLCFLLSVTACLTPLSNDVENGDNLPNEPWYRSGTLGSIQTPQEAAIYFCNLIQTCAFRDLTEAFEKKSLFETNYSVETVHSNFLLDENGRVAKDTQLGAAYDKYCIEYGKPMFSHVKVSDFFNTSWKIVYSFSCVVEKEIVKYFLIHGDDSPDVFVSDEFGLSHPKSVRLNNNWYVLSDAFSTKDDEIELLLEESKKDVFNKQEYSISSLIFGKTLQIKTEEELSLWCNHRNDPLNNQLISIIDKIEISGVQVIPKDAFCHLTTVKSVTLSDEVTDIEEAAFFRCSSLSNIQWSGHLKNIGDFSFLGCGIETLVIPNETETIGQDAFSYLHKLRNVVLPDSIRVLEYGFINCSQLESILLPTELCIIPDGMLLSATNLKELTIPDSVQTVGLHFAVNGGLKRLIIEGTPHFQQAFSKEDYPCLKQIVYLGDPPSFDDSAFQDLYGISVYYLNKNAESWEKSRLLWNDITIIGIDSIEELPLIEAE